MLQDAFLVDTRQKLTLPPCLTALLQAGVAALAGCMLYVLRGRISGPRVLPSATASAPAFQTPKNL